MWTMLTAWTIQLRTALARLQLVIEAGSLLAPAQSIFRNLLSASTWGQHQPWTWVVALGGARKTSFDSGWIIRTVQNICCMWDGGERIP